MATRQRIHDLRHWLEQESSHFTEEIDVMDGVRLKYHVMPAGWKDLDVGTPKLYGYSLVEDNPDLHDLTQVDCIIGVSKAVDAEYRSLVVLHEFWKHLVIPKETRENPAGIQFKPHEFCLLASQREYEQASRQFSGRKLYAYVEMRADYFLDMATVTDENGFPMHVVAGYKQSAHYWCGIGRVQRAQEHGRQQQEEDNTLVRVQCVMIRRKRICTAACF